jgi:hypothetical protein
MAKRSSTDLSLVVLGLIGWVAAALFGAIPTTIDTTIAVGDRGTATTKVQSLFGAGAAFGFALAGGMCFLGAALASRPAPASGSTGEPASGKT